MKEQDLKHFLFFIAVLMFSECEVYSIFVNVKCTFWKRMLGRVYSLSVFGYEFNIVTLNAFHITFQIHSMFNVTQDDNMPTWQKEPSTSTRSTTTDLHQVFKLEKQIFSNSFSHNISNVVSDGTYSNVAFQFLTGFTISWHIKSIGLILLFRALSFETFKHPWLSTYYNALLFQLKRCWNFNKRRDFFLL